MPFSCSHSNEDVIQYIEDHLDILASFLMQPRTQYIVDWVNNPDSWLIDVA